MEGEQLAEMLADISATDTPILVDLFVARRDRRLSLDREAEMEKEVEGYMKAELLRRMVTLNQHALASDRQQVVLNRKEKATPTDWGALYAFIKEHAAFELLQRRVNEGSVKERWESGQEVPGVGKVLVDDLTIRKLR